MWWFPAPKMSGVLVVFLQNHREKGTNLKRKQLQLLHCAATCTSSSESPATGKFCFMTPWILDFCGSVIISDPRKDPNTLWRLLMNGLLWVPPVLPTQNLLFYLQNVERRPNTSAPYVVFRSSPLKSGGGQAWLAQGMPAFAIAHVPHTSISVVSREKTCEQIIASEVGSL